MPNSQKSSFAWDESYIRTVTGLTKMDWERVEEDAEELTDNWAVAEVENKLPAAAAELQWLLE